MKSRELIVGLLIGSVVTTMLFTLLSGRGVQPANAQAPDVQRRVVDMEVTTENMRTSVWRIWSDGIVEVMIPTTHDGGGSWYRADKN